MSIFPLRSPLPPPVIVGEPDSFALYTIRERLPAILQQAIAGDFPAPFVALRTLKSEVVAGLQPEQVEWLNRYDPQWLINGQWGVIQYGDTMGDG